MKRFNQDRPRRLYEALCSGCGQSCRVPFPPSSDKPVYCQACFAKRGGGRELGRNAGLAGSKTMREGGGPNFSTNDIKTQLAMLNIKLDKIISLLK